VGAVWVLASLDLLPSPLRTNEHPGGQTILGSPAGVVGQAILTGKAVDMDSASGIELASAAGSTVTNGEMFDSVAGTFIGADEFVLSFFGVQPGQKRAPLGNEQAFENGRSIGHAAAQVGQIATVVYGKLGSGTPAVAEGGGGVAAVSGNGGSALSLSASGTGAVAIDARAVAGGLSLAASSSGNPPNQPETGSGGSGEGGAPNAGESGVLEGANFAQPEVNKARTFSPEGQEKYSALAGRPDNGVRSRFEGCSRERIRRDLG
jgi:hypothetical protein